MIQQFILTMDNTTELAVSTYVCILKTNIKIDKEKLNEIYERLDVVPYENTKEVGFVKIGVLNESKGTCRKMVSKRAAKIKMNRNNTFRNQIGSYIRILDFKEIRLTQNKTKLNKIKKGSYYSGNRFDINQQDLFIFKKGQTAFQFNSIYIFWNDVEALNTEDEIRITTSVARKSQESFLQDIHFKFTKDDFEKGYIIINFDKGCYANAFIVQSKLSKFIRIKVEFVFEVNMFLFTSGQIKVSGCTTDEHIEKALNIVISEFKNKIPNCKEILGIDLNDFEVSEKIPIMFNCDFAFNLEIKRFEFDCLIRKKYNILSSFEPNTHPAVKIKFYSNNCYSYPDGQCHCTEFGSERKCSGKGYGEKIGECKIVTILVFQSGEIILTGSRGLHQSQEGCDFIKQIICDNIYEIEK